MQNNQNEIILYQPDSTIELEVRLENETVWLNRQQMSILFDRDIKTIGNILIMRLKKNWQNFQLSQILLHFKLKEIEKF